jgi:hypothetical protein
LREEIERNAFTGLIAGIQVISKGLDDVVRRDTDVSNPSINHSFNRTDDTPDRADLAALIVFDRRHGKIMPEQLISSVYEVNVHDGEYRRLMRVDPSLGSLNHRGREIRLLRLLRELQP